MSIGEKSALYRWKPTTSESSVLVASKSSLPFQPRPVPQAPAEMPTDFVLVTCRFGPSAYSDPDRMTGVLPAATRAKNVADPVGEATGPTVG